MQPSPRVLSTDCKRDSNRFEKKSTGFRGTGTVNFQCNVREVMYRHRVKNLYWHYLSNPPCMTSSIILGERPIFLETQKALGTQTYGNNTEYTLGEIDGHTKSKELLISVKWVVNELSDVICHKRREKTVRTRDARFWKVDELGISR